ncbi:hypothetical protein [Saccharothrix hoggarensis]|uniref:Uncharacterized protein n=1 Tax=Saccharothrix hoggarensis TaxID=913853 RepID=A0ABW3QVA2_9PSEU
MTTALRLPDPFTPDASATSAATPTCCCCCCCCAASAVGSAIALPLGMRNDLAEADQPRRKALWVLPAALYPPGVALVPAVGLVDHWLAYIVGGGAVALLWAFLAAKLTGSAKPFGGVGRLLIWAIFFTFEAILFLPMIAVVGWLGPWFGGLAYLLVVVLVGRAVVRFYRPDAT